MEKKDALNILEQVANYITVDLEGKDSMGESRVYVTVPEAKGKEFAHSVGNALVTLGALTQEVYDAGTSGYPGGSNFLHYPVKGKGRAEVVKQAMIDGGVNFPGSQQSSMRDTADS